MKFNTHIQFARRTVFLSQKKNAVYYLSTEKAERKRKTEQNLFDTSIDEITLLNAVFFLAFLIVIVLLYTSLLFLSLLSTEAKVYVRVYDENLK